jgi:hypothetical protein
MSGIPLTQRLSRFIRNLCSMSRTSYPNSNREDNTRLRCAITRAKQYIYTKVTHRHYLYSCSRRLPFKKETHKTKWAFLDTLAPNILVTILGSADRRRYN